MAGTDGSTRDWAAFNRPVIEKFIQELGKGPPLSLVEHLSVRWLPASGRFAAFGIRYAEFEQ